MLEVPGLLEIKVKRPQIRTDSNEKRSKSAMKGKKTSEDENHLNLKKVRFLISFSQL